MRDPACNAKLTACILQTNTNDSMGKYFCMPRKIHGENIGELDYSYYSLSVFLKHPSIKKNTLFLISLFSALMSNPGISIKRAKVSKEIKY